MSIGEMSIGQMFFSQLFWILDDTVIISEHYNGLKQL